jgi:DNA-directed RNA polymerase subunit RPC12/RpoP
VPVLPLPQGRAHQVTRRYYCDACGKCLGKREPPDTVECSRCGHVNELTKRVSKATITVTK